MRLIKDTERRARLARRQVISPQYRVDTVEQAVDSVVVLHATEPATPFLSVFARMDACTRAGVENALYEKKTLVKQLAMRRTVFVFPTELLPAALNGPSAKVAEREYSHLVKDLEKTGLADDGAAWIETGRAAVAGILGGGREMSAQELRTSLDELTGKVEWFPDRNYGGSQHIAPRLFTVMGVAGQIVRGHNGSHWRVNRNRWTLMEDWLGGQPKPMGAQAAYAQLVERYLHAFGPVTEVDLVWWFGATKAAIRQALRDVDAVEVRLEREQIGWVLPDDVEAEPEVEPWAAVLPALDPTAMGWKDREFYLPADLYDSMFDWSGNCGASAWWNGQIYGSYIQDDDAHVHLVLGRDPGKTGKAALEKQAKRLERWLDGEKVNATYKAPIVVKK